MRFSTQVPARRLARETPRREGWVPCTTWWWVGDHGHLGRIALRHRLSDHLFRVGGHIGYDVRPSARRQGHATAMLRAVLPLAAARGITSALVTCDIDNVASAQVIAANGGVLENELDGKLRYWVPTGPTGPTGSIGSIGSANGRSQAQVSRVHSAGGGRGNTSLG